ncbi:ABC transporter substrate-binding protein [Streptomyces sp. H27-H1]|uniref:ABC transporter substrate-binding protein n=1 Tax=Streptomyces sp. H27-H1 TaxID=2996461 RepID=UPI0022708AA4|nr:ABC transporter substrate-binding protein [Streptomyces sp. H27-H1]MCY0931619.1 ABC transporter substrate-binding protein [Streptomyces sp. H27-H1]
MRQPVRLGIALVLTLATTACSTAVGTGSPPQGGAPHATAPTALFDSCGRQLSFSQTPGRAVTLDQVSTETLLALGLQEAMAGTANLKTKIPAPYEAAYAEVPVIAPQIATGEQMRAANPDFVMAGSADLFTEDRAGTRAELEALDVPTFVSAVDCPEHSPVGTTPFELLFSDYEKLGKVFGAEEQTGRLVTEQRAAVVKATEIGVQVPQGGDRPTVLFLYSVFNGMPFVAGGSGLPSEMSRIVGVKNAFDDVDDDWPEVSWEEVARRDPDFIVIGDLSERGRPGDSAAEKLSAMTQHPVVSKLAALRNNKVIEVPGIELDPSVRSVQALRLLAEGVRDLGHAR